MKQLHSAERNLQEEIRGGGTEGNDNNQATTMKTSTDHDIRKIALHTIPVIFKNVKFKYTAYWMKGHDLHQQGCCGGTWINRSERKNQSQSSK